MNITHLLKGIVFYLHSFCQCPVYYQEYHWHLVNVVYLSGWWSQVWVYYRPGLLAVIREYGFVLIPIAIPGSSCGKGSC